MVNEGERTCLMLIRWRYRLVTGIIVAVSVFSNNISDNVGSTNSLGVNVISSTQNVYGIGSKISLEINDETMTREMNSSGNYLSTNPLQVHFGMGSNVRADRLTINWPYGTTTQILGVTSNQFMNISDDVIVSGGFE